MLWTIRPLSAQNLPAIEACGGAAHSLSHLPVLLVSGHSQVCEVICMSQASHLIQLRHHVWLRF